MNRLKLLREQIIDFEGQIDAINEACEKEARSRTEEEAKTWANLDAKIDNVRSEISDLEKMEARKKDAAAAKLEAEKVAARTAGATASTSEERELETIKEKYDFREAFGNVMRGEQPKGIVAEMHEEAQNEKRSFGAGIVGLGIPSRMLESRATVDQSNSAIQPTVVGSYVDGLREGSLAMKVGVDVLNGLTADYKVPGVGANSVAWATAENSTAADGGAQFSSLTLNPTRATGYVDVSNRILLQNGNAPMESIMRDLGRATSELIDTAMFSTSSVSNAPASIPAASGVGTFTEATPYAANSTVFQDMVTAEQELADNKSLIPGVAYVAATNLIKDIKQSAKVSSVLAAADDAVFGKAIVNGYPCYFSTAVTKSAGVSGDFIFGDWSQVKLGFFGGLDLIKDPYSALLNDETRIVLHRHLDFGTVRGAAFIKATSLVA